jgi:hypothetical protein
MALETEFGRQQQKESSGNTKMTTENKRNSPRVQTNSGNYVIYVEGSGSIRDLSLTGVFVVDSDPLPVGTTINFELRLHTCLLPVRGIVRRSVPGQGMGIQFVQLSQEGKILLKSYLDTQARAPGALR